MQELLKLGGSIDSPYDPQQDIVVDCDGVLLNWFAGFSEFAAYNGIKRREVPFNTSLTINDHWETNDELLWASRFNESLWFRKLPALRDAAKYVSMMVRDHGVRFHVITSCGNSPIVREARLDNLARVFGENTFHEVHTLQISASKYSKLINFKNSGCLYIDDLESHLDTSMHLGMKPLLMKGFHNIGDNQNMNNHEVVSCWREVYEIYNGA